MHYKNIGFLKICYILQKLTLFMKQNVISTRICWTLFSSKLGKLVSLQFKKQEIVSTLFTVTT